MTKRMLIDDTHVEETRVVIVDGNKLEDVEFETVHHKQIKSNVYIGKVMRVEPSLQAAFVDYGGNRHGFLAFSEIHPDYYHLDEKQIKEIDAEIEEIIEGKRQAMKDREQKEKDDKAHRASEAEKRAKEKEIAAAQAEKISKEKKEPASENSTIPENDYPQEEAAKIDDEIVEEEAKKTGTKKRLAKKRLRKQHGDDKLKVMPEAISSKEESVSEKISKSDNDYDVDDDDDDDIDPEFDFELQRKLLRVRKLFHRNNIQDVVKEGQILLIQIVKEERGNKGAALTTYLSLAGRYCVLMPNRIKSGGVSRKITSIADRKRLKSIVKELPLTADMSMIVRTAGEEKTKQDIVRDYNYLMRSWNMIRTNALKTKAPALIHEEGNLIKRALRDMYTKEISEILVSGDEAYKTARDFTKILSPHNLKKIKQYRNSDMPLFQRFQVEPQLDKLHDTTVQLESGGYLVINPTEALVAIDVNSGRATKEKDLEETALKTNLEAADEVSRQLRLRNLAGLIVIDFIDMDENKHNQAVEKRMKEAMKSDRSRIQIGKMSQFGLMEISRQRMHSSFFESNYHVCPYCKGKGIIRSIESSAVLILRAIEEEGIKGRSSKVNIFVPADIAIYLLNNKRETLINLENRYKLGIIISADDTIKNIADYRIERTKKMSDKEDEKENKKPESREEKNSDTDNSENKRNERNDRDQRDYKNGRNRRDRNDRNNRRDRNNRDNRENRDRREHQEKDTRPKEKSETVVLYNSHGDTQPKTEEKVSWWQKLIK